MDNTETIVLRKTQYGESSLIVVSLSPGYGRFDFIAKGSRKIGAKSFPSIDLFRKLRVSFRKTEKSLHTAAEIDLLKENDGLSSFPENYFAACEISRFILKNSQPFSPAPRLFRALGSALHSLSSGKSPLPREALVKLVWLSEHGYLPDRLSGDSSGGKDSEEAKRALLRSILLFAEGNGKAPDIPRKYWEQIFAWADSLCAYHGL